jgi:hypothetical protein
MTFKKYGGAEEGIERQSDLLFALYLLISPSPTQLLAFGIQILNAEKGSC